MYVLIFHTGKMKALFIENLLYDLIVWTIQKVFISPPAYQNKDRKVLVEIETSHPIISLQLYSVTSNLSDQKGTNEQGNMEWRAT